MTVTTERSLTVASPKRPVPTEIVSVADMLAKSGFFTDCRQMAQAGAKVLAGRELGLPPFASMTGIYAVKGRLALSANAMATLIQKAVFPNTDVLRFKFRVKKHTRKACEITFFERESPTGDWEEVGTSSFDEDDQKLAKLSGDNWTKYPRNMMYARAMSNGAKWYCPAVFGGHTPYLPDEVDDRAKATDDGEYVVDGKVVQSIEVTDAEVIDAASEEIPPDWQTPAEPGTPLDEVQRLIIETHTDPRKIFSHYGIRSMGEMSSEALANCRQTLLAKQEALTAS